MRNSDIFYFDVDGTLLHNETHQISKKTLDSLKKLKQKGYKVALCTGRTYKGIHEAGVEDLLEWDAYVLANGSLVLDKDMQILSKQTFDPEIVKMIMQESSSPLLLEGEKNYLTGPANDVIKKSLKHFGIEDSYPIIDYSNEDVYNIMCYEKLSDDVLNILKKHAQILFDQLGNYEIIPLLSGKDRGIEVVNKHLGIRRHTAFGDGDNDVSMLQRADVSVAMENGTEDVKKVADFVTKSVEHDGIFYALTELNVI